MAIQLNPTVNDAFETKTLATLRQMVLDALGFIKPNNLGITGERTLLDLRTDIKNRLGLATPLAVKTDTLVNIRTDVYNMLGFAAMGTHPPGVDTMLNAFINQAQQFLWRAIELDKGSATAPSVLVADGDTTVLDRDAILRVALGNAKSRWRQADAQIYLAEAAKYIADLKGRAPPNIDALVNAALQDAERIVANRIEFNDFWVAGAPATYGLNASDTSKTIIDAEPVFLLALANLKANFKQDDAKAIGDQFETYMKNMVQRQPPNAKLIINRLLKDAQQYLYRAYPVFRMERWFTWTTVAGQRFYGVAGDDNATVQPPTNVTAQVGLPVTTGGLSFPRGGNTLSGGFMPSVLMNNGGVLIAGGFDGTGDQNTADVYTPSTGAFVATAGVMTTAREMFCCVALKTGQILVIGGYNGDLLTQCELYDPTTGVFTPTGDMTTARDLFTATLLQNGKVLVCGGQGTSAELYDPASNLWTATGNTNVARFNHTATLLSSGKVLITGGGPTAVNTAEIYNPTTGVFTATGNMTTQRCRHTATLLTNGNVLICGGQGLASISATAETYSPGAGTFTATTGPMNHTRYWHSATLLPSGKVLVAGDGQSGTTADVYNPATNTFAATAGAMPAAVLYATGVLLSTGFVLIAGGSIGTHGSATPTATAMLYNPTTNTFAVTGSLTQGTVYYRVAAFNANGTTTPSLPEASVSGVGAATAVNISWTASSSSGLLGYNIYGRATGAEQLIGTVGPTVTSYIDLGLNVPNGAMPTVNSTNVGALDARAVTWVGASSGDNTWRELIEGVDPLQYNGTWTGPPQRYEIRQAIEIWPTPADTTWLLRIKGYFSPGAFDADTDVNSIDWQAIYFKAVSDALRIYKRTDEAAAEERKLMDYIKRLVAGTHKTARYIPGNIPIRNTPPRPVIV